MIECLKKLSPMNQTENGHDALAEFQCDSEKRKDRPAHLEDGKGGTCPGEEGNTSRGKLWLPFPRSTGPVRYGNIPE